MSQKIYTALEGVTALVSHTAHLEQENERLLKGVAEQAKIIRELREELSRVNGALGLSEYNVEFLKRQGRKTRMKNRSGVQKLKKAVAKAEREAHDAAIQLGMAARHLERLSTYRPAPNSEYRVQQLERALAGTKDENRHLRQHLARLHLGL